MNTREVSNEKLVTDVKRVVRDSEELLKDSASAASGKIHEVRERLAQTVESAKAACGRLEEKAREGAKATDKVIREHPYQSLGIAFGVGLLIGVLATRK